MEGRLEQLGIEKLEKVERYRILNQYARKSQILFVGSSLMEQFPINEFIQDFDIRKKIYNRGIGGFTTRDMLLAMDEMVYELDPQKIFINIGTNDISLPDYTVEKLIEQYASILANIKNHLPYAKLYIMAFYPVNGEADFGVHSAGELLKIRTNARINEANHAVKRMADRFGMRFINVNERLLDENGNLKKEFSIEGIHMYANGYQVVFEELRKYIED